MSEKLIIAFDGTIDLATGKHRNSKRWKNESVQWSKLVEKLSVTHVTPENLADYLKEDKSRQDEIKDIGGFVGGYLDKGRRLIGAVSYRQLITLDADFAKPDLWDTYTMLYGNAAAVYSTHKHNPSSEKGCRYRLIIPLDRHVTATEYEAVSRYVANALNIEMFDPTTYQPNRLMYWPSTSKDGVYEFQYQDGPWLCVDEVLACYEDWQDTASWPLSTLEKSIPHRAMKKQGDPLEKPGIVGAFCRTYDIHSVISTYLVDVYEPCDVENRYTFKEGSTAAGLVVYDDKYAYSHHGTDPVSGKLCNAFDLVRHHKFGGLDLDKDNETASNTAMLDFASKIEAVVFTANRERMEDAGRDFDNIEVEDLEWLKKMDMDRKGNCQSTINNIVLVLQNDPVLKDALVFDDFEKCMIVVKNLPWRNVDKSTRDFTDQDVDCLAGYLEEIKVPFTMLPKALSRIQIENKTHPIREYLSNIQWDGVKRLDKLFIEYLGCEDSEYTRAVTRKTFVAAVARVFKPGIKFDTAPVLVGDEGEGKSTVIAKMGKEWFSDCLGDVHTKEGMESLRGVWIMEVAELSKFKNADSDAIRRFISSLEDIYRPAYAKQQVRFPRQCIFIGTTNRNNFLASDSENRRFLPLQTRFKSPVKHAVNDLPEHEVDQLWAEAVQNYKAGESLDLSNELKQVAKSIREVHTTDNGLKGIIENYLDTLLPANWDDLSLPEKKSYISYPDDIQEVGTVQRIRICAAEIWCELFGKPKGDMNEYNTKYVHEAMRNIKGWKPVKDKIRFPGYGAQRGYIRVENIKPTGVPTLNQWVQVDVSTVPTLHPQKK